MKYMLDTNICIYAMKNKPAIVAQRIKENSHFGISAAAEYGKICAYLQKQGTPIGAMDMLIAAHALSKSLIVVTNNVGNLSAYQI